MGLKELGTEIIFLSIKQVGRVNFTNGVKLQLHFHVSDKLKNKSWNLKGNVLEITEKVQQMEDEIQFT